MLPDRLPTRDSATPLAGLQTQTCPCNRPKTAEPIPESCIAKVGEPTTTDSNSHGPNCWPRLPIPLKIAVAAGPLAGSVVPPPTVAPWFRKGTRSPPPGWVDGVPGARWLTAARATPGPTVPPVDRAGANHHKPPKTPAAATPTPRTAATVDIALGSNCRPRRNGRSNGWPEGDRSNSGSIDGQTEQPPALPARTNRNRQNLTG